MDTTDLRSEQSESCSDWSTIECRTPSAWCSGQYCSPSNHLSVTWHCPRQTLKRGGLAWPVHREVAAIGTDPSEWKSQILKKGMNIITYGTSPLPRPYFQFLGPFTQNSTAWAWSWRCITFLWAARCECLSKLK
jgi:hypothetical protein